MLAAKAAAYQIRGAFHLPRRHQFACRRIEVGHEMREVIDALAVTYSHDLVRVTDLIHSRLDKRAHQFADAFRWKKEGK